MKKWIALLLVAILCLSLCACSGETQSDSSAVEQDVDARGNTIIKDEDGTVRIIDQQGNLRQITMTNPEGIVITQNYDEKGNMLQENYIQADGVNVIIDYDENGNKIQETNIWPDGTVVTFRFDENGNKIHP